MAVATIESAEELKKYAGRPVGVTEWIPIEQSRINGFADVTQDHQWIHVDTERAAKESPFGATIAHGFLTLSLLSHMWHQVVRFGGEFTMGINYGLNRLRFPAPVRVGSRVRGHFEIQSVEEIDGGVHIVWGVRVEVEGSEKPCLVAEWLTRAYR